MCEQSGEQLCGNKSNSTCEDTDAFYHCPCKRSFLDIEDTCTGRTKFKHIVWFILSNYNITPIQYMVPNT